MKFLVGLFAAIQGVLALRVFTRMARTANGKRIQTEVSGGSAGPSVSIIVPVLDEEHRIAPCLAGLVRQGAIVREILVVDGGSNDFTPKLIDRAGLEDTRIRRVDTGTIPQGVNGKAYGLKIGSESASSESRWLLTIDADVRLHAGAVEALVRHAERNHLRALSVASTQRVSNAMLGLIHPSMLTTLVYRFGIPGYATTQIDRVQANGQCFLVERELLAENGGFDSVLGSVCEDITLARSIAHSGVPVGFYEAGDLVEVEMYADARDAWRNWPRSLPMRDRYAHSPIGLLEVLFVQALPFWGSVVGVAMGRTTHPIVRLESALLMARLGVLAGTARAYPSRPWTYWLSPVADVPVILEIIRRSRQRSHIWRGRTIVAGESS